MTKFLSFIATILLATFLFGYDPSKTEGLIVLGYGLFMAGSGYFAKEDDE
jgi:hypothetical protein